MKSPAGLTVLVLVAAAALASGGMLSAQTGAPPPGDAKHGQQIFVADGCYECHNYQGQGIGRRGPGQNPGPNLAPAPISYRAFVAQLRKPRVAMPPYSATLVSDADAADLYAYLASQPPVKPASTLALLASVDTGDAAGVTRGRQVFYENCAQCHGATGAGSANGPSLLGENGKKDLNATIATIKSPTAPMTKLYPGLIDDADVAAVAAYVQSLH